MVQFQPPEVAVRRYRNRGWLFVVVGVLIPGVAALGARRGWRLRRLGRADGLPLLVLGSAVFVVRLALWASTGFHAAW